MTSFGLSASETPIASTGAQAELALGGAPVGVSNERSLKDGDTVVLVGQQGTGFALTMSDISQTKRNGRRVMKLRDGEFMVAAAPLAPMMVFITRDGSGLAISQKEIPVRDSAAVGVVLMGVRDNDALVACCGTQSTKMKGTLLLDLKTGKTKDIPLSEVTKGHRALKGTKVYSKEEIVGAKIVEI